MGLSLSIESQTQPDRLYHNLVECPEVERQREAVAVFEAVAELAVIPKQSLLTHEMEAEGDEDMTPAGHVAKSLKLGVDRGQLQE